MTKEARRDYVWLGLMVFAAVFFACCAVGYSHGYFNDVDSASDSQ